MGVVLAMLLMAVDLEPCSIDGPVYCSPRRFPVFAFAPASGSGMGTECAGTVPTGAKGETMTFTRATIATCVKSDGTVVALASGQPSIHGAPGAATPLGIDIEGTSTNIALRTEQFENAAWVASATVTANAYVSPDGATTADRINDTSGAAIQGVCQAMTVAVLEKYAVSFWVKPDTASAIQITLAGTGNAAGDRSVSIANITGDSHCINYSNGWSRCGIVSPARYAAGLSAVTACLNIGTVVGTTGQIAAYGAQVETSSNDFEATYGAMTVTSYIPTTTVQVSRNVATLSFAKPAGISNTVGCAGISLHLRQWDGEPSAYGARALESTAILAHKLGGTASQFLDAAFNLAESPVASVFNRTARIYGGWSTSDSLIHNHSESTDVTATYGGTFFGSTINIGTAAAGALAVNALVMAVALDSTRDGCL